MKRFVLKVILFFILILLSLSVIDRHFINPDRFNGVVKEFNKSIETNVEESILFVGSSRSFCTFNPAVFDFYLGGQSFNLSSSSQLLNTSKFLIEENIDKTDYKLIVLNFSRGLVVLPQTKDTLKFVKSVFFQNIVYDNYRLSINKIKSNLDGKLLSSLSPTYRNHSKWDSVLFGDKKKLPFIYNKRDVTFSNNGFTTSNILPNNNILEKGQILKKPYNEVLVNSKFNGKVNAEEIEFITSIKKIINESNSKLLVTTSPSIRDYNHNLEYYEKFETKMDSLGINYLNLNKHVAEIKLKPFDFYDQNHLTYNGSIKVSEYLSKYIKEKYKFNFSKSKDCENITCHLYNNLDSAKSILDTSFDFNDELRISKIKYFNELKDQYVFVLEGQEGVEHYNDYVGYVRYYNTSLDDKNKTVESFQLRSVNVLNKKYFINRIIIPNPDILKFDIFFIRKKDKKVSKLFSIKNLNL
ncbi:hypothetical protein [Psychroserpens jangbogonensis]|uniref:hypothetical protein n=1 Tax=Psychroserpens jangbogonensis TaxID=1484460 RepID=UPI00053E8CF7|nr:hypothetical protein [Psychroserpens jangbogonensis]